MESAGTYLLSVTAAAIVSAIVVRLLEDKGGAAAIGRILCALFVAFTVFTPLTQVRLSDVTFWLPDISAEADAAVAQGRLTSDNALKECISQKLEAYILDKAAQYGVALSVRVELSDDAMPVPKRVHLQGNVSPYTKTRLQSMIAEDLGIDKENQLWT